jgi:predicted Zn-dependent protease
MGSETASLALARRYLEIGRPQQTLDALAGMANPDLDDPELWFLRAAAQLELGWHSDAARAARDGLARAPDSTPLLATLAAAESELGHAAEAERAILAALELEPDSPWLLVRYAILVARAGQLDKAERLVEEAGRVDPTDPDVMRARSLVAYLQGGDRDAEKVARELLSEDPEDVGGLMMLGSTAAEAGRIGEADKHFAGAARLEPSGEALQAARELRFATHPLLWPVRPVSRLGAGPIWAGAIATIIGLRALGFPLAAAVAGGIWLLWCAYTWIVPPLVRRWVERRWP